MLFKDPKYNSLKYSFEHEPDLEHNTYSYLDVCKELFQLSQYIHQQETIVVNERFEKNKELRIEHVKESVCLRDVNDIHNVIVRKPEFKKRLKSLHIEEPENKDSKEFVYYLQFVYFFYICIYFIFPDIRFLDIFLEKNWSAENIIESDMGMERYEEFILHNLFHNPAIQQKFESRIQEYDDAYSLCQDAFFSYYSQVYDEIMKDEYSKENAEVFEIIIDHELENIHKKIVVSTNKERNVFDSFLDFIMFYRSSALNHDMVKNLQTIDFESLLPIYDRISNQMIDAIFVPKEELENFIEDNYFKCACMNVENMTKTNEAKFASYQVYEAVEKVWDYEQSQMEMYPLGQGFTFLTKEDDTYYMNSQDIFILAMLRIYLPVSLSYTSKRLDLKNRSNASKKQEHSIKHSYSTKKKDNMDTANSAVRDDYFRICARFMQSMMQCLDPNEFLYFELRMNIKIWQWMDLPESYEQVEQRIEYFKKAQAIFEEL